MKQETGKNPKNSMVEMQKLMASPEGKELLALLSEGGGLQAAMKAFQKGDMKGVREALEPAMSTQKAGDLLRKINEK
ncbi:MAG: hypothetical protein IKM59_05545 [Oscillospiraceae bacterium]|nr:hypothetical protein [Oscillospiraceae bacterium]